MFAVASGTGTRSARRSGSRSDQARLRRTATALALAVVAVSVARRLAPKLHARLLVRCERMFDQMPDEFPPKRMLRGIEELRADSARALELLEKHERGRETTNPSDVTSRSAVANASRAGGAA